MALPSFNIKFHEITNQKIKHSENLNSNPGFTFGLLCELRLGTIYVFPRDEKI